MGRGRTKAEAIKITADESSRSIFQSAAVFFVATFGVYLTCDISIVKSICLMLARGSLISAVVIVCFLPSVLSLCEGVIAKTSFGWRKKAEAAPAAAEAVESAASDTQVSGTAAENDPESASENEEQKDQPDTPNDGETAAPDESGNTNQTERNEDHE